MGYTVIPQSTFQDLQLDAGVLLNTFDPTNPGTPADTAIICATTGGLQIACVPEFEDFGEDVDNCPNNTKELKRITGWNCTFSTTALAASEEMIKLSLGAATVTTSSGKIAPNRNLAQTDFEDAIWWVGDRADGGLVAVKLINALSTGGFSLQTEKKGKGKFTLELTGHVSISAQDVVPMEFYVIEGTT